MMYIKLLKTGIFIMLSYAMVNGQQFTDNQLIDIDVSKYQRVHLYNTNGKVNVKSGSGNVASFKAERKLKAKSQSKLTTAKNSVYMDTLVVANQLYIFINNPYQVLELESEEGYAWYNSRDNGKWRWSNNSDKEISYEFTFDVSLPANTNFVVSTHREDINVDGIGGELSVMAHYGDIDVKRAKNVRFAKGHHGNVKIDYSIVPVGDSVYRTHHGDITLAFPSAPSADVSMSSHHGTSYTDFDWKPQPTQIRQEKGGKGTKYKYGGSTNVRIGGGKAKMSLKTHHGDMFLLKRS